MNSVRVTVKLLENQRLSQLLLKSNYILMTGLTFHDYISHFSESIMLAKLQWKSPGPHTGKTRCRIHTKLLHIYCCLDKP